MTDDIKRDKKTKDKIELVAHEPKHGISLSEALEKGVAILKVDMDRMILEELAKGKDKLEKRMRQEVKDKLMAERLQSNEKTVKGYMEGTGLTDVEFGTRLKNMHVNKKYLSILRNDHKHLKKDKQIWDFIRIHYKGNKV